MHENRVTNSPTGMSSFAAQAGAERAPTQAEAIIAKFGGAIELAKLLGVEESTVYRWTYSKDDGGTDGLIPSRKLRRVLELAKARGVVITAADLYPTK